jgi:predicted NUDIX family phosphoesterase
MSEALVMVVETALLDEIGPFQGLTRNVQPYLEHLLAPQNTSYRPRAEMEKDPSFKQLIPYVVFSRMAVNGLVDRTQYFVYTRTKKQGEQRLHGKRSLGVGGHIEIQDDKKDTQATPYALGLIRELMEEVQTAYAFEVPAPCALLNDDSNEVGAVHLGVVHLIKFDKFAAAVTPKDPEEMVAADFQSLEWLQEHVEEFESWSQIVIRDLLGQAAHE